MIERHPSFYVGKPKAALFKGEQRRVAVELLRAARKESPYGLRMSRRDTFQRAMSLAMLSYKTAKTFSDGLQVYTVAQAFRFARLYNDFDDRDFD